MKKALLFIIIVFLTSCASTGDKWSKKDIALEATWQTFHALDWGTTLDIENHPNKKELNPILGNHPSRNEIHTYMAIGGLAHIGVTHLLPKEYRPWWQVITIFITGGAVINNFGAGLSLAF